MKTVVAYISSGDIEEAACTGCGSASHRVAWSAISEEGATTVGHMLICETCRPDWVWSCAFCPDLMPFDAAVVMNHLCDCIGATRA